METKLKLTDDFFKNAKALPGAERTIFWDTKVTGFGLVVTVNGAKTYVLQYRAGRQSRRMKIRSAPNVREARKQAGILLGEVNKGHDPLGEKRKAEEAVTNTLKPIAENYLKREGKSLRSIKLRRSTFERNVFPTLGTLPINNIRRSDITKMMDRVEEECGPAAADEALAFLSRLFSWHAARSDEFRSPIVRGMRRTSQSERARQRILTDDELASVWKATAGPGSPYGALVRFLLLTDARRDEARRMPHSEIAEGVWTIPASRYKTGNEVVLPLSKAAQSVLAEVPMLGPFVFSSNGHNPIGGLGERKAKLDKLSGVTGWRIHDLRRTARSLMSRAGVDPDVAERCLGHVIGGVRGVYDRHSFLEEKRFAFEKLATLIEGIVNPQENVVLIRKA